MLYAANGSQNVTVVDGATRVGLQAPNGSYNVVVSDPDELCGLYHASGAMNVILVPENGYVPTLHRNGSRYVSESRRDGALFVTVLSGSLGSAAVDAPNVISVIIEGTAEVGETLEVDGTATGTGDTAYQWLRNGLPIVGADEETYELTEDDLLKHISVTVSISNATGSDSMISAEVTVYDPEELPQAPEGFAYLVGSDDEFLLNADDAYILVEV